MHTRNFLLLPNLSSKKSLSLEARKSISALNTPLHKNFLDKDHICYTNQEISEFKFFPKKESIREEKITIKSIPYFSKDLEKYIKKYTKIAERIRSPEIYSVLNSKIFTESIYNSYDFIEKEPIMKMDEKSIKQYLKKINQNKCKMTIADARKKHRSLPKYIKKPVITKKQSLKKIPYISRFSFSKLKKDYHILMNENMQELWKLLKQLQFIVS